MRRQVVQRTGKISKMIEANEVDETNEYYSGGLGNRQNRKRQIRREMERYFSNFDVVP